MAVRYCVFWIPTIYHTNINPLSIPSDKDKTGNDLDRDIDDSWAETPQESDFRELETDEHLKEDITDLITKNSDIADQMPGGLMGKYTHCKADVCLKAGTGDIHVSLRFLEVENKNVSSSQDGEETLLKECHIILVKKDKSHNGLFSFIYEAPEEDDKLYKLLLLYPIYHIVKKFYHKHKYHDDSADSTLVAYISSIGEEVDIKSNDNRALISYLKQYELKFISFADQFEGYLKVILNDFNSKSVKKWVLCSSKTNKLEEYCRNVLGEAIYYYSLKCSKYNQSCKDYHLCSVQGTTDKYQEQSVLLTSFASSRDSVLHDCEKDCPRRILYRTALNADNALKHIKLIRSTNIYAYLRYNEKFVTKQFDTAAKVRDSIAKNTDSIAKNTDAIAGMTAKIQEIVNSNAKLTVDIRESLLQSDKISRRSYILGWLGFIVGILGGILGGIGCYMSFKTPDECAFNKSQIEQVDSIKGEINRSVKLLLDLQTAKDSIANAIVTPVVKNKVP